uniref:Uncharacterized protein n=1 Tax=Setaria digitata TaxID=48799 RepID=A0A915PP84_9BILA
MSPLSTALLRCKYRSKRLSTQLLRPYIKQANCKFELVMLPSHRIAASQQVQLSPRKTF